MKNYLKYSELKKIGFKKIGKGCQISKLAFFYNPKKISIGDNVRIDDFVIFSTSNKEIKVRNNVTIGRSCHINGSGGVELYKNVILSTFVTLHSSSHNYRNPNKKIKLGSISIFENSILGSNSIVIGPCKMKKNSSLGSLSLLKRDTEENSLYAGIPAIRKFKK